MGVLLLGGALVGSALAQEQQTAGSEQADPSPWYLERGTERRDGTGLDDTPEVAFLLAGLLRDGGIPGFYDGQFAATVERFDDLVRVAQDRAMHHTIRIMAVMALQEAAEGERLRAALEPLLLDPDEEFRVEWQRASRDWQNQAPRPLNEDLHRLELDIDLSRYTRFALAKSGQPGPIRERIAVLEQYVLPRRVSLLDPLISTFRSFDEYFGRTVWFDIGYHYQQFDDYASAAEWFGQLTANLEGVDARMAHYNLACIAALSGEGGRAVEQLRGAVEDGFLDVAWMLEDGDLVSVRERDDFRLLVSELLGEEALPSAPEGGPVDKQP